MDEPLGFGIDEIPDRDGAFPRLDDEQLGRLRAAGELRAVRPGEVLFAEGQADFDFFVIESVRGSRSSRDTGTRTVWSRCRASIASSASSTC